MTDKFLKEIRGKISCPQFGDDHYGEWGILNVNQRRTIKRLIDYMDGQEAYIKNQQAEIEEMHKRVMRLDSEREEWSRSATAEKLKNIELQAEIERLQIRLRKVRNQFTGLSKMHSEIKAEAIKEFAERLKKEVFRKEFHTAYGNIEMIGAGAIDNLVKEMVGEDK